jgi:hypothetical protein
MVSRKGGETKKGKAKFAQDKLAAQSTKKSHVLPEKKQMMMQLH